MHALLQQTPCEQNPLAHSLLPEQGEGIGLRPHELMLLPFMPQMLGGMHSVFALVVVQAVKHLLTLQ